MFNVNTGCYLELSTHETMKLLGSTKSNIIKDKNGENVHHLEITEAVFVQCNIVNNDYQQASRVLCTSVPNKPFGQLFDVSPIKIFDSEFSYIEISFTDQNYKPLEIEDEMNITLVIN